MRSRRNRGRNGTATQSLNNRMLAVVRVSATKQKDGYSPDDQREKLTHYAESRGLEIVDVVSIWESAKDPRERPKYDAVIRRLQKERIGHLAFYVWDRATRNLTNLEELQWATRAGRFAVHVVYSNKMFDANTTPEEWLAVEFETIINKQTSHAMVRRALDNGRRKALEGWYPHKAPFGYRNVPFLNASGGRKARRSTIELLPWGRNVVRRMYDLRMSGADCTTIGATLLSENLIHERYVKSFSVRPSDTVTAILTHVFYQGQFYYRGELFEGKHEPVFTRAEWQALQDTFRQRRSGSPKKHGLFTAERYRLVCDECGCLMTYAPATNASGTTYRYYRCANGKRVHQAQKNADEQCDILLPLGAALDAIALTEETAKAIAASLNESTLSDQRARRQALIEAEAMIETLIAKQHRLYDRFDANEIDRETYAHELSRVRTELSAAEHRRKLAQEKNTAELATAQIVLELAKSARSLWDSCSDEEKRNLAFRVVLNPRLNGTTLRFDLKKPFAVLAEMTQNQVWRARPDSNR